MTVTIIELVKFTDDNDTIIMPSSDKREWCALNGNVLNNQQRIHFWRK